MFKKIFLIFWGLALVAISGVYFFSDLSLFKIEALQTKSSLQPELLPLHKKYQEEFEGYVKNLEGHKLTGLSINRLKKEIMNWPWIEQAQVVRKWPDKLVIEVKNKDVLFSVIDKKGKVFPVSPQGDVLPSIEFLHMPTHLYSRDEILLNDTKLLKKTATLFAKLPSHGSLSLQNITRFEVTEKKQLVLHLRSSKNFLKLGTDINPTKVRRVVKVIEYLEEQGLQGRVIDANFSKKVLVRLRKGS